MVHHRIRPKGYLRKDRDYLLFEKGSFLFSLQAVLSLLRTVVDFPPDANEVVLSMLTALENRDLDDLFKHTEAARRVAWKYLKTPHENKTALLLMWLDAIDAPLFAEAKAPDEHTENTRKKVT